MNFSSLSNWGPYTTPKVIRRLIIFTLSIATLSAAIQTLMNQFAVSPGPQDLLSLSWQGLKHAYIWQPFTFLFIQETSYQGLTLFFLLNLAFSAYILWNLGSSIVELVGEASFLKFFFFTGISAALLTLFTMPLTGQYVHISGNTPAMLALLTAWSMAYGEAEIHLFFLIPIRAKWVVATVFSALALVTLTHLDFTSLILYSFSVFLGYTYAIAVWSWRSPFPETAPLDNLLISVAKKLRRNSAPSKDKVIDIETGKAQTSDEAFVDAMLAKISKYGEGSLSWLERRRLEQISNNKSNKH